jgi:hypothetical protein
MHVDLLVNMHFPFLIPIECKYSVEMMARWVPCVICVPWLRYHPKGGAMGFSGLRAIIMLVVLVVLILAVTRFDLPGWLLPVGLLATGALLKGAEKAASDSSKV